MFGRLHPTARSRPTTALGGFHEPVLHPSRRCRPPQPPSPRLRRPPLYPPSPVSRHRPSSPPPPRPTAPHAALHADPSRLASTLILRRPRPYPPPSLRLRQPRLYPPPGPRLRRPRLYPPPGPRLRRPRLYPPPGLRLRRPRLYPTPGPRLQRPPPHPGRASDRQLHRRMLSGLLRLRQRRAPGCQRRRWQ